MLKIHRRNFLGASLGGLATPLAAVPASEPSWDFKLGVATYSLRKLSRARAIAAIQELHTPYVSVKEFHLLYRSTPQELAEGRQEFERAGLKIMSGGNIGLSSDDPAELRRYFEYARMCGMPMMVCAPTHRNLASVEKLVKEYDIRIAIHNHGPEDKQFPTPQSVLSVVREMDPRCGLCLDVGHTTLAGANVLESVKEAGTRLFDMHIKDLRSADSDTSLCDVGEGIIPVVGIFKLLHQMGYSGCVNLEYEIHPDDPLPGMKNSFSYMRGVLAGLRG